MYIQMISMYFKTLLFTIFSQAWKAAQPPFFVFFFQKKKTKTMYIPMISMYFKTLLFTTFSQAWGAAQPPFFVCFFPKAFYYVFASVRSSSTPVFRVFFFKKKRHKQCTFKWLTCTSRLCFLLCFHKGEEQFNPIFFVFFFQKKRHKQCTFKWLTCTAKPCSLLGFRKLGEQLNPRFSCFFSKKRHKQMCIQKILKHVLQNLAFFCVFASVRGNPTPIFRVFNDRVFIPIWCAATKIFKIQVFLNVFLEFEVNFSYGYERPRIFLLQKWKIEKKAYP